MSNEYDDTDEDQNDEQQNGTAPKALRQQNSKLNQELAAEREARQKLEQRVRQIDIADALEQHGAPKKLAKYVNVEVPDSDGVLAWLRENGEDFGWSVEEQPDDEQTVRQEQATRVSRASQQAPEGRVPTITPEYIRTAPREELVRLGIVRG